MSEAANPPAAITWWKAPLQWWALHTAPRQGRLLLVLSIVIGALTGLAVVAFILLTERLGMRLYPVGSAAWRARSAARPCAAIRCPSLEETGSRRRALHARNATVCDNCVGHQLRRLPES